MDTAQSLQAQHGIPGIVTVVDLAPDYPAIQIDNRYAKASIALLGGHVMTFQPHGQEPVLWLSKKALFKQGTGIRGGIPVCWPWFGPHPANKGLPSHGFVRTRRWTLKSVQQDEKGATQVILSISDDASTREFWPHAFELEMTVLIDSALSVSLKTTNRSRETCAITSALHTYQQLGDISQVEISGLDNTVYLDKVKGNQLVTQQGAIHFNGEMDRVYQNTRADIVIHDPALKRQLRIQKSGSNTTVIWNPWIDKSASMADFDEGGYRHMVCVEAANAIDDVIQLEPDESHSLQNIISIE